MRKLATATLLTSIFCSLSLGAGPSFAGESKCDSQADACVKYMIDNLENKGWIGIELEYEKGESPSITRVIGKSPAEAAGLLAGDVLVALDGVEYASATEEQLRQAKEAMVPGREVRLALRRDGEEMELPLTLGRIPPAVLAQWVGSHLIEQHRHEYQTAEAE